MGGFDKLMILKEFGGSKMLFPGTDFLSPFKCQRGVYLRGVPINVFLFFVAQPDLLDLEKIRRCGTWQDWSRVHDEEPHSLLARPVRIVAQRVPAIVVPYRYCALGSFRSQRGGDAGTMPAIVRNTRRSPAKSGPPRPLF